MAQRIRSRLAKKESERLVKQSLVFFVLTILLIILIIFFGIPFLIKIAGTFGEMRAPSKPLEQADTIAPLPPVISTPFEATSSASISIQGATEADSKVVLFNNGNKVAEQLAGSDGFFTFASIQLQSGDNTFVTKSSDSVGNESGNSKEYIVVFDDEAPTLEISEPSDGNEFLGPKEQAIAVKGKTDKDAQVYINGRFTLPNSDGDFSQRISLSEGDNNLVIKATDKAGNSTEKQVKVTYKK